MAPHDQMRWTSALSERIDPHEALAEAAAAVREDLQGEPDLTLLFASDHFASAYAELSRSARAELGEGVLIGCSATGVIGQGREVERREALSLVAARLPRVDVRPFHCELPPDSPEGWSAVLGAPPTDDTCFVLLCDPFSLDAEGMLRSLDAAAPRAPKVGGVISGAQQPGDGALFLGPHVLHEGMVGVALRGDVAMRTLVSQGCRPIGEPMIITRCSESVIQELNVGTPMLALRRLFAQLPPRDQELARHSLYVGIEMGDGGHRYGHGDFLVREVGGIDPDSGAMMVHGQISDYQVVQFHLRDASAGARDLESRLVELERDGPPDPASGALFFSCLGRGEGLYGVANHDSDLFCRHMGAMPMGGFFGNGEIGPVGGRTFVHGYTGSFAIFGPAARDRAPR
jgi:small ligand-binding sensory domain FIST